MTREEAVGYLIAGPAGENFENIATTLKLAVDKNFFQEKYVNDLFDILQGVKLDQVTDVWSEAGRRQIILAANQAADRIAQNPATYYAEMLNLIENAKGLLSDPANLKFPASEIKSPKAGSGPLTLVASYYESEAAKAVRQAFNNIVTGDFSLPKSPELVVYGNEIGVVGSKLADAAAN